MIIENITSGLLTNSSATFIPVKLVAETSPYQFWLTLVISAFTLLFMGFIMSKGVLTNVLIKSKLKAFSKLTGKETILIKHDNEGLFSMNMITTNLIPKLNKILQKMNYKNFNLVLQTPGGDVFATVLLSKIFKDYPGKIDVYVPNYSMSGGSLLTLTGDTLHFNNYSCVGPIDPQIGGLFSSGSASGWREVLKVKKNKADDKSIIFHRLGNQVEKSMYNYIFDLIKKKCKKPKEFAKFITNGNIEHIFQIDAKMLKSYGFDVVEINMIEKDMLDNIVKAKLVGDIFSSVS